MLSCGIENLTFVGLETFAGLEEGLEGAATGKVNKVEKVIG